jgi:hypothetical protein
VRRRRGRWPDWEFDDEDEGRMVARPHEAQTLLVATPAAAAAAAAAVAVADVAARKTTDFEEDDTSTFTRENSVGSNSSVQWSNRECCA